jgi:cytochrome bd ubiquinol oxidase subunit II
VVLDGFDLGLGIIFPLLDSERDRDTAVNSVAPVWDGNETWLVLGGGGLLAAFPLAYAVVLPALYAPILAMLLGLVFRGVAFEFRWRSRRAKPWWDAAFFGGSLIATLAQGVALGALVQGIRVANRAYAGGWYDWLSPFSIMTGIALVIGYGLLGATWLIMKTEGPLQDRAYRLAWPFGLGTLILIGVVSLWTPFLDRSYMERWFSWPNIAWLAPVPLLVLAAAIALFRGLVVGAHRQPFFAALALFVLSYAGLGISFWPWIVPRAITIHDAAAPDVSLAFLLAGAAFLLPMILGYTIWAYWVFRGKVGHDAGYH